MMKPISRNLSHRVSIKACWSIVILAALLVMILGCSAKQKVLIPPKVDLKAYKSIGIIEFSTNAEDGLDQYVTQEYMQTVQSAQPGIRILELGNEKHLLGSMKHHQLDLDAIKSIGKKYNVDAIMFGHLKVSKLKPKIRLSSVLKSIKAKAEVEARLSTRVYETESGATIWTKSSMAKDSVANLSLGKKSPMSFGASNPKDKYGKLVVLLVDKNTTDFRSHSEYK